MGGGTWDDTDYNAAAARRAKSGKSAFDFSDTMRSSAPASAWKAHEDLDPKGVTARESRDSDEHPESLAIAIAFDETGSMGGNPVVLQEKLKELFGLLLRKGYAVDPQIMMGAYGDAETDRVPLQVGQFESDIRIDENLRNLFLEGNGGGNGGESAALYLYFLARHTSIDCWEKRGKKGYAFLIGDETSIPVTARQIKTFVGDEVQGDLTVEQLVKEVQERYNLYFLLIDTYAARAQRSPQFWGKLVGKENLITLQSAEEVSSAIAAIIGKSEGAVDHDGVVADLVDVGISRQLAERVGEAVKEVACATTAVAKSSGGGLPSVSGGGSSQRI